MAKKTTELVLLFPKNITKLVFLWPNMGQKSFKVLRGQCRYYREMAVHCYVNKVLRCVKTYLETLILSIQRWIIKSCDNPSDHRSIFELASKQKFVNIVNGII